MGAAREHVVRVRVNGREQKLVNPEQFAFEENLYRHGRNETLRLPRRSARESV